MVEFHVVNKYDFKRGNFPLNHDCVLKVRYLAGTCVQDDYLTCCSEDSGSLVALISALTAVYKVYISSIDSSDDIVY